MTGTFDDWGKTEKLNKVGNTFEKEVRLPDASDKILYKVCQEHASEVSLILGKRHTKLSSIYLIRKLKAVRR